MVAGIREILIISTPTDTSRFEALFKDGSELGLSFSYAVQKEPRGLAEAFLIGEHFIDGQPVALILGDNIFYGHNLRKELQRGREVASGGLIFGYQVKNPSRYGVVEFDEAMRAVSIEEKPKNPKSNYAVPGLYFYGPEVVEITRSLQPSSRGELEITDVNQIYLQQGNLKVELMGRGFAWLDTGTFEAYQQAANYVQAIQERQGIMVACIEEIAYRLGYIDLTILEMHREKYSHNEYGEYLKKIFKNG